MKIVANIQKKGDWGISHHCLEMSTLTNGEAPDASGVQWDTPYLKLNVGSWMENKIKIGLAHRPMSLKLLKEAGIPWDQKNNRDEWFNFCVAMMALHLVNTARGIPMNWDHDGVHAVHAVLDEKGPMTAEEIAVMLDGITANVSPVQGDCQPLFDKQTR